MLGRGGDRAGHSPRGPSGGLRDPSTASDLQRSPGRVSIRSLLPLYYFSKMKTALFL